MTERTLKTVLVLDTETQWYKPVAHNLSDSQAADLVIDRSAEGNTVKSIDQENRHRSSDAAKCKPCKEAALKLTDESAAPDAQVSAQE
jgi:nitrous oxide reductase accessory protein NosL